jgi:hypothetical protein
MGWKDAEEAKVSIVDMSERGLRVRWRAPLRLGMEVKAFSPDDVKVYRVMWVREAESSEHGFDIGLELRL